MFAPFNRPPIPNFEDFVNAPQWTDLMHRMAYADSASIAELQQQVQQQIGEQWRVLQQLSQWIQDASSQLCLLSMSLLVPTNSNAASASSMSSEVSSATAHSDEASPNIRLMQQFCQFQLQQRQQPRQPYRFNPETATNAVSKSEPYRSCQTIALRARAAAADITNIPVSYDGSKSASTKKRPAAALPIREIMNPQQIEPEPQPVRSKDMHAGRRIHSIALSGINSDSTSVPQPSCPASSVLELAHSQPNLPASPMLPQIGKPTQISTPSAPPLPQCKPADTAASPPRASQHKPIKPAPPLLQCEPASSIPPAPPLPQREPAPFIPPAPPLPPAKPISARQSTADAVAAAEQQKTLSLSEHSPKANDTTTVSPRYKYGVARATCPACSDLNRRAVSADCDVPSAAKSVLQLARMFDKQNGKGVI
ncbi:hypothetical protein IWW36_000570 [Coemansia brasiliensis]|uniref:Uncharacterized protein n=1 Tax=Coemansia brasiliensis TaxID=2650707 RepID=A0A9W8M143_9FUNG|nr:hypothetical protein IWW36_000570 [Coemansia brasiliensis]